MRRPASVAPAATTSTKTVSTTVTTDAACHTKSAVNRYYRRQKLLKPFSSQINQEAQLSQRDRATLRVIEYFAKSPKVIRNDTVK